MHKSVDSNIVLLYHSTQIDTPSSDGYAFHKSGFCYRKKPRMISSVGRAFEWNSAVIVLPDVPSQVITSLYVKKHRYTQWNNGI